MTSKIKSSAPDIHIDGFPDFIGEFIKESDRAAVILGAAKIDSLLGHILDKYLLPSTSSNDDLLEGDSPLASFSARIKICHRLGLIDDHCAKLLNVFRRLRNGFAHEVTQSSLSHGSARDRVISMAEPFLESPFFQLVLKHISDLMERPESDLGVIFRGVLTVFYLELGNIHRSISCTKIKFDLGIIETTMKSPLPKEKPGAAKEPPEKNDKQN